MNRPEPWCLSYTGKQIHYNKLTDPETTIAKLAALIDPVDICQSLSIKYRFTGFTSIPWSVLSHTVIGTALLLDEHFPDATLHELQDSGAEFGFAVAESFFLHDFSEFLVPDFNNLLKPSLRMVQGMSGQGQDISIAWRDWEKKVQSSIIDCLYYPTLPPRLCPAHQPVADAVHRHDMIMARLEAEQLHCFSPSEIETGNFGEASARQRTLFQEYIHRAIFANRRLYVPHYSVTDPGRLQFRDGLVPLQPENIRPDNLGYCINDAVVTIPPFDSWRAPLDIDGLYGPWQIHHPQLLFWIFLKLFCPSSWFWGSACGKPIAQYLALLDYNKPALRHLCTGVL